MVFLDSFLPVLQCECRKWITTSNALLFQPLLLRNLCCHLRQIHTRCPPLVKKKTKKTGIHKKKKNKKNKKSLLDLSLIRGHAFTLFSGSKKHSLCLSGSTRMILDSL